MYYSYVAKGAGGKPGMSEEPEQAYFSDYVYFIQVLQCQTTRHETKMNNT